MTHGALVPVLSRRQPGEASKSMPRRGRGGGGPKEGLVTEAEGTEGWGLEQRLS